MQRRSLAVCVIVSAHCREPAYRPISRGSKGEGLLGERWICERSSGLLSNGVSPPAPDLLSCLRTHQSTPSSRPRALSALFSSSLHQRNILVVKLVCSPEKLHKRCSLKSLKFSRDVTEVPHEWKDDSDSMGQQQSAFRMTNVLLSVTMMINWWKEALPKAWTLLSSLLLNQSLISKYFFWC